MNPWANIIGNDIVFYNGITYRIIIIYYAFPISIYYTITNCEAFSMNKVNAFGTIIDSCNIFKIQIWIISTKSIWTRILNSKIRYSWSTLNTCEINPVSTAVWDRIILYCHHTACSGYVNMDSITRTSGIVVYIIVPYRGAFSFNQM